MCALLAGTLAIKAAVFRPECHQFYTGCSQVACSYSLVPVGAVFFWLPCSLLFLGCRPLSHALASRLAFTLLTIVRVTSCCLSNTRTPPWHPTGPTLQPHLVFHSMVHHAKSAAP